MSAASLDDRTVTVLGTGRIGSALARRWAAAGWRVTAWNRTPERAAPLFRAGVIVARDLADAVRGATRIVTIVSDGEALERVVSKLGEPGRALVIDLSTIDSRSAENTAEALALRGMGFVAGALSGSPALVESGRASVMLSGSEADVAAAEQLFAPILAGITVVGGGIEAKVIKIAINSMVGGAVLMLAEATVMVEAAGIGREALFAALAKSAIWSPVVQYKSDALRDRDFTITATTSDLLADISLADGQHRLGGVAAPVTAAILAELRSAVDGGYGPQDCITVTSALQARAGMTPDAPPHPVR
jgi:3-hydroxyisobutyrate dehydrogenase-like beta-hydroxyacid dehydrogenase